METINTIIPKGSLFFFSSGEYSDYYISLIAVAEKDINVNELRNEWIKLHPDQKEDNRFGKMEFINWLSKEGYFEEKKHFEFHLCDYGSIDEMSCEEISK